MKIDSGTFILTLTHCFSDENISEAEQRGPRWSAMSTPLVYNGVLVAMQRAPRCKAVRPLRHRIICEKVARFRKFHRNTLILKK